MMGRKGPISEDENGIWSSGGCWAANHNFQNLFPGLHGFVENQNI